MNMDWQTNLLLVYTVRLNVGAYYIQASSMDINR